MADAEYEGGDADAPEGERDAAAATDGRAAPAPDPEEREPTRATGAGRDTEDPDYDDVCVLIPTYNEAGIIGDVIEDFRSAGFDRILVVDGHSTDGTREIAADRGAEVIVQSGTGKGNGKGEAVREGVDYSDRPYVLMLDGDGTYLAKDADRLLSPLFDGTADHVIGDRFADMQPGAMTRLNRLGNWAVNKGFAYIHGRNLEDILSGYRAFTRDSFERMHLGAEGFGIETEMSVECVKHDITTRIVEITYEARPDGAETNLRPFRDGATILLTLYLRAKTHNPLFYFGSLGLLGIGAATTLAAWLAYEWVVRGISHEVIAVVAGVVALFGVLLLIFGILSDMIVTLHREQMARFDRLAQRIEEED